MKSHLKRVHLKLVSLGILLTLCACGVSKPKVQAQPGGELTLPPFPSQEVSPTGATGPKDLGFGLTNSPLTQVYEGRLIFWDDLATPEAMNRVNQAVIEGRLRKKAALEFAAQEVLPLQKSADSQLKDLETAQATYLNAGSKGLLDPNLIKMARDGTDQWFESTLERLANKDPYVKDQDSLIRARWQGYCDGKIWELATSTLATATFTSRPTPQAFCEPYYRSQQYFSNEIFCQAAPGDGRSYFQCLWREGVMKTPQWLSLTGDGPTSRCTSQAGSMLKKAAVEGWLKSDVTGTLSPLEALLSRRPAPFADQGRFATAVLGGSPFRRAEFSDETMAMLGQCPTAFQRKSAPATELLSQAAPIRLLEMVEIDFDLGYQANMRPMIPLRPHSKKAEDLLLYEGLTQIPRRLGTRFGTAYGFNLAVNDILFNQPVGQTLTHHSQGQADGPSRGQESLELFWNQILPENETDADPMFRPMIRRKNTDSANLKAAVLAAESIYLATKADFDSKKQQLDQLLEQEHGATIEAIRAVNAPQATRFFSTFGLKISRQPGILWVEWNLDQPHQQCLPLDTTATAADACAALLKDGSSHLKTLIPESSPLTIAFDPGSNKITLNFKLDSPEDLGFKESPRSSQDLAKALTEPLQRFNDIPYDQWKNRRLELEIYGQRMNDIVDIFSGNATLWEGDRKILWGSISGDRFDQMLRHIQSRE